jgi:predicted dehydrogenase
MAMAVRLGLVGAGRWGRNLIRTIRATDGVTLARVASRNPETAALVAPETEVVTEWQAVTDAGDLDGIVIAIPPRDQTVIAKRAIANGLPVLMEKPLALDIAEAAALCDAVAQGSAFVMVDHTHLFSAAFEELLAQSRRLGQPLDVVAEAGNWGPFRRDASVLFDWGAHDVAMVLALFGEPPTVVAAWCDECRWVDDAGEGASWRLDLRFGGASADIAVSNLMQTKRRRFCANFASATLLYDDLAADKLTLHPPQTEPGFPATAGVAIMLAGGTPLQRAVASFVAAIGRGRDDTGSLNLGMEVVKVLAGCSEAERRSAVEEKQA